MKKSIRLIAAVAALAMTAGAAACGSGASQKNNKADVSLKDINSALTDTSKTTDLTVWAYSAKQIEGPVKAFQKRYPHIKINFVNTGAASDHFTKFQNVVSANKGVPDVVQMSISEYEQYAVSGALLNFESDEIEKAWGTQYAQAAWKNVHFGGGLYGTPQDAAPLALYVRKDILDEHGLKVPTTWQEFYDEGVKLHKQDPSKYMGFISSSDTSLFGVLRTVGAKPWTVKDTTNIDFSLTTGRVAEFIRFIQKCLDDGVLRAAATGTDEFNREVNDGVYATRLEGCWQGNIYKDQNPSLKGKMVVAHPLAWGNDGESYQSESTGSMFSISSATPKDKQAAALAFIQWVNGSKDGVSEFLTANKGNYFMASNYYQKDKSKRDQQETDGYFANTNVNEIYFESMDKVNMDWDYIPFPAQLTVAFGDTVAPALTGKGDLLTAFTKLQDNLKSYAEDNGFKVTTDAD